MTALPASDQVALPPASTDDAFVPRDALIGRLLTTRRLRVYPRIVVVIVGLAWLGWMLSGSGNLDRTGKPLGADFVTFWAASSMERDHDASQVYNLDAIHQAETAAVHADTENFAWHYPPPFLLAVFGLSLLPYALALAAWLATTAGLLLFALRRVLREGQVLWLALAFPGTVQNLLQGQTGFLTAAILGGGLMLLEKQPVAGGLVLGFISYKPQFAPLVFLVLLASRRWSALGAAIASALALAAVSYLAFGWDTWSAFLRDMPSANQLVYDGELPWAKMPTVNASLLLLGAPALVAQVAQGVVSMSAAAAAVWLWRAPASAYLRNAGLCLAVLLAAPFAFDYDLVVLGLPLLWLGLEWRSTGWRTWERELLTAAWLAPLLGVLGTLAHVSPAPLIFAGLLWLVVRRVGSTEVADGRTATVYDQPIRAVA